RELENAVRPAVVLGRDSFIRPDDLPEAVAEVAAMSGSGAASGLRFHDAVRRTKIDVIERALAQAGGHPNAAARLLGLHPNYLHRLIRNLQLRSGRAEGERESTGRPSGRRHVRALPALLRAAVGARC